MKNFSIIKTFPILLREFEFIEIVYIPNYINIYFVNELMVVNSCGDILCFKCYDFCICE